MITKNDLIRVKDMKGCWKVLRVVDDQVIAEAFCPCRDELHKVSIIVNKKDCDRMGIVFVD